MIKKLAAFLFALGLFFSFLKPVSANSDNSFVTVVNPVRGEEFWDQKNQKVEDAVLGEAAILDKYKVAATWLLRYDAFSNSSIISSLKSRSQDEKGLFLEITPSLTKDAGVKYHKSQTWHSAGSIFLTGYNPGDRLKIIDTAFSKYKAVFGDYPKSVGAWWIDSYSLAYMQSKYGILSAMIVADQYSTDNYQIWGQYWGSPYYPSKTNDLTPAQDVSNKTPVVITQWAARDPVNGYGNGVEESTYSVQANDYIDYHELDTAYFSKLVDIYTKQPLNKVNQLTVGLENSYSWQKYKGEYENQIKTLAEKQKVGQFLLVTDSAFAKWYMQEFSQISPAQVVVAQDPLGSDKRSVWFMDNYYRLGWFSNQQGSVIRDIHQYVGGSEELCLTKACDTLNFATSATRVLDDVSFNQSWEIDQGKISDFKFNQNGDKYSLSYINEAGKQRLLEFYPRDISLDNKISTVDVAILNATAPSLQNSKSLYPDRAEGQLATSPFSILFSIVRFLIFLMVGIFLPGQLVLNRVLKERENLGIEAVLSFGIGVVLFTLLSYLLGFLRLWSFLYIYLIASLLLSWKVGVCKNLGSLKLDKRLLSVVFLGSVFQLIPVIKSGLLYDFGVGFWGPNGHDGIWHLALINQLMNGLPIMNPVLANTILKNYHFFFDLLLASTSFISHVSPADLLFRFYPAILSILLGLGVYYLSVKLFSSKIAALFSLFFVYFGGSFGFVVDYIKNRGLGGESAFWANQALSFNLNPPFAISLVLVLCVMHLLLLERVRKASLGLCLVLIAGSLVEFKSYAGIIVLGSMYLLSFYSFFFKREKFLAVVSVIATILSALIFVPNLGGETILIWSPFWLVHSMIDFPDRVGWTRLSNARLAYEQRGEWFKFFVIELISLTTFILGNLGMRFVGLFSLSRVKTLKPFLFGFLAISSIIPLLFIQTGTNWNIVQFFYYFIFVFCILAGSFLEWLYKLNKKSSILIIVIIILGSVTSLTGARDYFSNKPAAFISLDEISALSYLSKEPSGVILSYPFDKQSSDKISAPKPLFAYDTTAYVSAYSHKPSFIEDEVQNDILQTSYTKRVVAARDFFGSSNQIERRSFLKTNNIRYIYALKYYNFQFDETVLGLKKIFENNDVDLYKVN